ncbi:MAG: FAD-dependent oxidoreductase [Ignisphaera sp.]
MKFAFMCREPSNRRGNIAVIGAGPAGLAATGYLACQGYEVDVYEKLPYAGGTMMFAIPSYKISSDSIIEGVEDLRDRFSVKFFFRTKVFRYGQSRNDFGDEFVERVVQLENIVEKYSAILISTGTWQPINIAENVKNVITAFGYLYSWRLHEEGFSSNQIGRGRRAAVIGTDIPAVEVVRKMIEQGFEEIYVLYGGRASETHMGWYWMKNLYKENVKLMRYIDIKRVVVEHDFAKALEYTEFDYKASRHTTKLIEVDLVVVSLGSKPTPPALYNSKDIGLDDSGRIVVDGQFRTKIEKVYASGSIVYGLIYKLGRAFRDGLNAAKNIDLYLYRRRYA